ncbi:hypothetical protein COHA_007328 [Chlorella ohadii]|uniref:Uncharacterized protein n=1 Tax=Chlorella ohadii TaxID=2649997 RepID=A0AAD5DJ19_9CHLO|nr:hypothetical protein COHA_007328 [Chlorella ohadii]
MMFFIRKLGRVLGDLERQSISEAALLKQASVLQAAPTWNLQVQGLQSEYTRMVDSGGAAAGKTAAAAAPSGPSAAGAAGTAGSAGAAGSAGLSPEEVGTLRKLVADLEAQNSKLQAAKENSEQEHAAAEANLSALKTQARGLENEYDRLLAQNDQLKTRLARAGLGEPVAAGGFAKKDE